MFPAVKFATAIHHPCKSSTPPHTLRWRETPPIHYICSVSPYIPYPYYPIHRP